MDKLLLQYPLISLIVVLGVIIPTLWKVFDTLYKKPRDFRIQTLENNVGELRDELLRVRSARQSEDSRAPDTNPQSEATPPAHVKSNLPSEPSTPVVQPQEVGGTPTDSVAAPMKDTGLKNLSALYGAWRNENMTDLQIDHFEKTYVGKSVTWDVVVDSVNPTSYGKIVLHVHSPITEYTDARASAKFDGSSKERLLSLSRGQKIRLTGTIQRFFLWPELIDCDFAS